MGYRGKVEEQLRARELRAAGMTVPDIAAALGVSRSSVSLWVRDVPVPPMRRRVTRSHTDHPMKLRRLAEIAAMDKLGAERLGVLGEQAFLAAGAALYAGEGGKREGSVGFANTDPQIIRFFLHGSGGASRSTRHGCARRSTSTRSSTSPQQRRTGPP